MIWLSSQNPLYDLTLPSSQCKMQPVISTTNQILNSYLKLICKTHTHSASKIGEIWVSSVDAVSIPGSDIALQLRKMPPLGETSEGHTDTSVTFLPFPVNLQLFFQVKKKKLIEKFIESIIQRNSNILTCSRKPPFCSILIILFISGP